MSVRPRVCYAAVIVVSLCLVVLSFYSLTKNRQFGSQPRFLKLDENVFVKPPEGELEKSLLDSLISVKARNTLNLSTVAEA